MASIWTKPDLSDEIIKNGEVLELYQSVKADILSGHIDITQIIENMGGVLTHKEPENRGKGMKFFTKLLQELPKNYLSEIQVKFISKFYVDRLKDHHCVIPSVLEGYLTIMDMTAYNILNCVEFFNILFREVQCQSQVRQDRYHIYLIIKKLLDKDIEFMKTMGPDFVYGFISSMEGEKDPRNLLFLFTLLPTFISNIPLGHLVDEMFEVISCYYPIDFHPSPDDPAAITRQELATALNPCLCAISEFGEQCLILLIEKLDSSLKIAKIDSLKLLTESCKTFKVESYSPFLKALWSSINREMSYKSDDDIKMAAHESLLALVAKLSTTANTDQIFETFVKGILITSQQSIAEATTVIQFVNAIKLLLTAANASKESCLIIQKSMIPATVAYYGFNTSPKLQIASLDFLGQLYEMAKCWDVSNDIKNQINEIPQLCLTAVSQPHKEFQLAGFKTLNKVINALQIELVVPFVEVLIHVIQHSNDNDLLAASVETVHNIARKYPEIIMNLVVKGKCDLEVLTEDKATLHKRLNLLSNLASIDEFTKVIIEEMLKFITKSDKDAPIIVNALNESMSKESLYSNEKVAQIESDHGLIESILNWLNRELDTGNLEALLHGFSLVENTIASLPIEKQQCILNKQTSDLLRQCESNEKYFLILVSLYSSLHQSLYDSRLQEIMELSLKYCLWSSNDLVRNKGCILVAHFLNKAEHGVQFEFLYELLKNTLSSCNREDTSLCSKLITLYGWITKSLVMRGSDVYMFWLQKIVSALANPEYCYQSSEAMRLIMSDQDDCLSRKQHCRASLLYKQRMYQSFSQLMDKNEKVIENVDTKEAVLLSWAYVLRNAPKSVIKNDVKKLMPLIVDSLEYDNKDLLLVSTDILYYFVQNKQIPVADSLQTILPRLINLTKYVKSMDVRIQSLQCLYEIANTYPTALLLPHKQDILLDMATSLDDKKRLVRNIAVKARTRWFLVGSPGEAKNN